MNYKRRRPRTQPGGCWCKADKVLGAEKTKYLAAPETPAPRRSHKDRKRWCGGRVGREHRPRWIEEPGWRQRFPKVRFVPEALVCEECGRKSDYRTRCEDCGGYHRRYWVCDRKEVA